MKFLKANKGMLLKIVSALQKEENGDALEDDDSTTPLVPDAVVYFKYKRRIKINPKMSLITADELLSKTTKRTRASKAQQTFGVRCSLQNNGL